MNYLVIDFKNTIDCGEIALLAQILAWRHGTARHGRRSKNCERGVKTGVDVFNAQYKRAW
jgi:hypothetical protein